MADERQLVVVARRRRWRVAIAAILVGTLAGCGTTTTSSSPSCAVVYVTFNGHAYRDAPHGIDFEVSGRVGTVTYPPCDDTNPGDGNTLSAADRTVTVYRVVGLDPDDGIAIRSGDGPNGYRLLGRSTRQEPGFTPRFDTFLAAHNPDAGTQDTTVSTTTSSLP